MFIDFHLGSSNLPFMVQAVLKRVEEVSTEKIFSKLHTQNIIVKVMRLSPVFPYTN